MAILGVGTDLVHAPRFERWREYSEKSLRRIFHASELLLALQCGEFDARRLALHFALKEAFYKALSSTLVSLGRTSKTFSFLAVARFIVIQKNAWGIPEISPDWAAFERVTGVQLPPLANFCSVSHERDLVMAFVVITGPDR